MASQNTWLYLVTKRLHNNLNVKSFIYGSQTLLSLNVSTFDVAKDFAQEQQRAAKKSWNMATNP